MSAQQDIIDETIGKLKKDNLLPEQYIEQLREKLSSKIMTEEDWALLLELSVSKQEEK
ncbi:MULTISPECIES: hypothetical protein [Candidatus Avelusimicrobium]|uniref:hypothetical protein n=1 Tax=Candidatus Avelusimicrobium TaxID=2840538 RepID=UPI0015A116ED